MFGSELLDMAIGMVFVFLLVSLLCSAMSEYIESVLKFRALDLERGMRELLHSNQKKPVVDYVAKIYDHPLVNGLYKGGYAQFQKYEGRGWWWRWVVRIFAGPDLPSYIPARNFALALMDAVLPANQAVTKKEDAASPEAPSGAAGATRADSPDRPAEAAGATGATGTTGAQAAPHGQSAPPAGEPSPLQPLREAISKIEIEQTRKALLVLVDAAGNDVVKARENIEGWFNSSMDRVSGWYKRRSHAMLLLVGFGTAVALNIDAVHLMQHLSTDKAARESLVKAAENYSKANPGGENVSPRATSTAPADIARARAAPASASANSKAVAPKAPPAVAAEKTASPPVVPETKVAPVTPPVPPLQAKAVSKECNADSPECRITNNLTEIKKLQLPIGWLESDHEPARHWPGAEVLGKDGWVFQINQHWLGWFLTALAVSLGAPFWFDLLNKIIVVRSTVKPHEKSPEEKPKS